ncbi:hypothetical protein D9756_006666 [Leucocoprinus leucothites]|uniref:Dipeptidyl-peptidase V n=1 Tax=Leucocoprinus leucothites TaxID=201217 RepID=A0A8H5LHF6_9AGAR|nr:hypothetical protein D9756_006666 [Leucoagaricus leucothites]
MGSKAPSINGTSPYLVPPTPSETVRVSQSQVPDFQTNPRLDPGHTPTFIASQPKVRDVRVSPDGKLILYQVTQFYRPTDRTISTLWLAETNKPQSAIPLTSGKFNDRSGIFHPDGTRILFLSDRQTPGKGSVVYSLSLGQTPFVDHQTSYHRGDGNAGNLVDENHEVTAAVPDSVDEVVNCSKGSAIPEPTILTSKFSKKGVQGFEISPSGKLLAFSSPDESSPNDQLKIQEKNDAVVIGSKGGFSRLRVYDFASDSIRTLDNVATDKQLEGFTWSAHSKEILYRLRQNRGTEWSEFEVALESISVVEEDAKPKSLGSYPRSPAGSNIWLSSGHIASLQNYEPENVLDARTLHVRHLPTSSFQSTPERIYGVNEDAVRILRAHVPQNDEEGKSTNQNDFLAVEVSHDTDSHIDIITFSPSSQTYTSKFTLFRTSSDAIWFNSWDAKRIINPSDPTSITYVFAAVLSSGPRHEPPNAWSGTIQVRLDDKGNEEIVSGGVLPLSRSNGNLTLLSNHLTWLSKAPVLKTEVIHWKSKDGVELSGLVRFPPGYNHSADGRLPTILFLHGGPYRRDIPDYMPYYCNWRELCASAGYLTISPNYRGSQGRGHSFAYSANAGVGVYDWMDCDSMVDEVVKRGWADESRLGVAGWSHGGSLTAWGVTQTKTRYKAAVVGAGATNWEGMVMESASPELEAAIGGSPPWPTQNPNHNHSLKDSTFAFKSSRKSSPIHNLPGITTSILILHGERDERVPTGQAYGFYRGLKRCAAPKGKEGAQLVVYPREPHGWVLPLFMWVV